MILHIDMDAFFASVEQQINPDLKGKPVIVGARDQKYHTVVTAASYEAKAYGIDSGMPTARAFKICPHAAFVACDSVKYIHVSREICRLLEDFAPAIEHTTIDEFDLETTGLEPFFGSPLDLGKAIKDRVREAFGLNCSIGIAPTWLLAKLASKLSKPDGLSLINESNLEKTLQGVPIEKVCGIGPALTAHLQSLGIVTCDQLKSTPEELLIDNFGRTTGHWLYASLRTQENLTFQKGDIKTRDLPASVGHSYTLPSEIRDRDLILSWTRMLCEMVAERLRKNGLSGHTVSIWVSSDIEAFSRQKTYQTPTDDGWEIFMRSRAILAQTKGQIRSVWGLGVSLSGLTRERTPPLLIEQKKREELLRSVDRINSRYGDWTLLPATLIRTKNLS
jgi:DNA polymerase-4